MNSTFVNSSGELLRAGNCAKAEAVNRLLEWTCAEQYADVLEEFWESWLTNEANDGACATERSERLGVYKQLILFFLSIRE